MKIDERSSNPLVVYTLTEVKRGSACLESCYSKTQTMGEDNPPHDVESEGHEEDVIIHRAGSKARKLMNIGAVGMTLASGYIAGSPEHSSAEGLKNHDVKAGITQIVNKIMGNKRLKELAEYTVSSEKNGSVRIDISTPFLPQAKDYDRSEYIVSFDAKSSVKHGKKVYDEVERLSVEEVLVTPEGPKTTFTKLIAQKDEHGNWILSDTTHASSSPSSDVLHGEAVVNSHSNTSPGKVHYITDRDFKEFTVQAYRIARGVTDPLYALTHTPQPRQVLFTK